ncbi:hypothetical protein PH213_35490 [Streptomyces sp. SRF1]|uniref:hypothetical protein n=1 Tax=Streptomyces sp. SRF1 TaxID=1549642 RepID=UPI0025B060EF|nr:hypothetical protein [Streptomyces sp. SRF1]MDN3059742.1 hypothetical protein [Streptomyces sp. SRF1]
MRLGLGLGGRGAAVGGRGCRTRREEGGEEDGEGGGAAWPWVRRAVDAATAVTSGGPHASYAFA